MGERYTPLRAWSAEGARVGITTCTECGAALLIEPYGPDVIAAHDAFHAAVVAGETDQ